MQNYHFSLSESLRAEFTSCCMRTLKKRQLEPVVDLCITRFTYCPVCSRSCSRIMNPEQHLLNWAQTLLPGPSWQQEAWPFIHALPLFLHQPALAASCCLLGKAESCTNAAIRFFFKNDLVTVAGLPEALPAFAQLKNCSDSGAEITGFEFQKLCGLTHSQEKKKKT